MESLDVWLGPQHVATVERHRGRLKLAYTSEALRDYQLGTPVLSRGLPLSQEPFPNGVTRAFFDGLLPEADTRRSIAADLGLRADDTFGLLEAIGRDCAGAIVVQGPNSPPPAADWDISNLRPLLDGEIEALLSNLRNAPLGLGRDVRVSLGGVQEKLLLTALPGNLWAQPTDGAPSTHILKPEIPGYEATVSNEFLCMRVAAHLGLPVAQVERHRFGALTVLVVERFDRQTEGTRIRRLHQEDLCQAFGYPPTRKYQEDGGPSFRDVAQVIAGVAPKDLASLAKAMTLMVLLGNGDAHGKNYAMLHHSAGIGLAPLYDLMCTKVYRDQRLAMSVDGVQRMDRVRTTRLVNEVAAWGMSHEDAGDLVSQVLNSYPQALANALSDASKVRSDLRHTLERQLESVTSQRS